MLSHLPHIDRVIRLRSRRLAHSGAAVFLDQRPTRVVLEVAGGPCHQCLDDLIADDEQAVARAGVTKPPCLPERCSELRRMREWIGTTELCRATPAGGQS